MMSWTRPHSVPGGIWGFLCVDLAEEEDIWEVGSLGQEGVDPVISKVNDAVECRGWAR